MDHDIAQPRMCWPRNYLRYYYIQTCRCSFLAWLQLPPILEKSLGIPLPTYTEVPGDSPTLVLEQAIIIIVLQNQIRPEQLDL